jgi:predicted membrane protein
MASTSQEPQMDFSMSSWLSNTYSVLHFPITVLSVTSLLVAGTFAEMASRKSLEFLDNIIGTILFFIVPFIFAFFLDWATGLLAAVVSLIIFTRLQKPDSSEGFSDNGNVEQSTKIISNPHRWFVERILGESPVAISSDKVVSLSERDQNIRTSSSSFMSPQTTHQSMYSSMNLSPSHASSSSNK